MPASDNSEKGSVPRWKQVVYRMVCIIVLYISAIVRRMIELEEQGHQVTSSKEIPAEARIVRVSVVSDDALAPTLRFEYTQRLQCEALRL